MKLQLESTTKTLTLITPSGEVEARIWEGHTESGIPVHCYITRIAVAPEHPLEQFDLELKQHRAPSPEVQAIPLRLIL